MASGSGGAVFLALIGNSFLTITKFIAFFLSRSPAMLSEAIHSFADTANQGLLWLGIRRSNRPADERYHWGYGGERFLFALLSAVGIFVLGCGVTVYHGVHSLLHPPELTLSWVTFVVLGISLVVDMFVLRAAIREINGLRGDTPFWTYVRKSQDPTLLAVLFEDFVATGGVLVALAGILLAHATGRPEFDAASSIIIGLMLGVVAIWLGFRNRELILGPAVGEDTQQRVVEFLESQPSVEKVRRVRTRVLSADRFAFAADVDYDGKHLGRAQAAWVAERVKTLDGGERVAEFSAEFGERLFHTLAEEVDRIEAELKQRFPDLGHVDLESDEPAAEASDAK